MAATDTYMFTDRQGIERIDLRDEVKAISEKLGVENTHVLRLILTPGDAEVTLLKPTESNGAQLEPDGTVARETLFFATHS